jgi:hypothetical protein
LENITNTKNKLKDKKVRKSTKGKKTTSKEMSENSGDS